MSEKQKTITLRIDGVARESERVGAWEADVYAIDGRSRGPDDRAKIENMPVSDAVLELELANGTHILVAAEDAADYLGEPTDRSSVTEAGTIDVGPVLRFSDARLPQGVARDGLGAWILKGFKVWRSGPSAITALAAAGTFQDAVLDDRLGLYHCSTDAFELTPIDEMPATDKATLLFLHGTASSTEGSFGGLWGDETRRKSLKDTYGARIYAYEHRSMTDSPISNTLELVKKLPPGARLHLVSHSRGGMVGELLARANRVGEEPFSDVEIDHFIAQAERSDRKGFTAQADELRLLSRELRKRKLVVERFVRVACPARGTTLASGRLDRWASVMLNLVGKGVDTAGNLVPGLAVVAEGYTLLQNFLLAVVKQRTDATILPGLEAMMPDSPLVSLLNAPGVVVDSSLHVIAGDFDGDGLLPWLGDRISEVFYGGETDLVVNTPSMSGGAARAQGIRQLTVSGAQVTHFTYFKREQTAKLLLAALAGNEPDGAFVPLDGPSLAFIARGGRKIKRKKDAPIVFLLPGIMGSHIQKGSDRIWFEPFSMWTGGMVKLKYQKTDMDITPDGWMDRGYEDLADYLGDTYEVRPFAYDWRRSIREAAELFGKQLDDGITEARRRNKPLRIVAHSMGGLVARLALKDRWNEFKSIPGSRLLQLGTPNRGSHAIANVLMARDDFIQSIERWFDWKHDMREFIEIVRDFPGVLELLPWPGADGRADDGVDYFDAGHWKSWFDQDHDEKKKDSWVPPQKDPLKGARETIDLFREAPLDRERTLYVAGRAPTPVSVRIVNGQVEIGWTDQGDGRVAWSSGIPEGVRVWYTDAAHGDLASHGDAFDAYLDLLESGDTRRAALSRNAPGSRGDSAPMFMPRSLEGNALYPSEEELKAAAMGGARPTRITKEAEVEAAVIEVVNGSLAISEAPVLIGAYANDSLRGSAGVLDAHLGGQLDRIFQLGRYPGRLEDAMVFRHPEPHGKPGGAIVVGLGTLGDLLPGMLRQAFRNGLLEYARDREQCPDETSGELSQLSVSTLLVGTGFTGLTIETCIRSLLQALRDANMGLQRVGAKARIAHLTLYEEIADRAVAAADALSDLLSDARFAGVAHFDGKAHPGAGGFRGRCDAGTGQPGTHRVHVVDDSGSLRFTIMTDRARNEVIVESNQRQAVDGLIESMTRTTRDQPGLSRAVFELMVPNGMKEPLSQVRTLMMSLDERAAAYPWELIRDAEADQDEGPLVTRVELVRQLATMKGWGRVPTVTNRRAFIVGDTLSDFDELESAQQEARTVAGVFNANEYDAEPIIRATAMQVFEALFDGRYRFVHLAGHGVVNHVDPYDKTGTRHTGMVIGKGIYLTPAQVAKIGHVPEFVFINCCHLGDMKDEAQPRWGELAANLATQFINMGCKAVIAAGWAVDDAAAQAFAEKFYQAMFQGRRFGEAVRMAREATYRQHRLTNTWGAYQAYGDELYCFPVDGGGANHARSYAHVDELIADLDKEIARSQSVTGESSRDAYRRTIAAIEDAARGPEFQRADVRERFACAWADLGDLDAAIAHYRAALSMESATCSMQAVEQLANLEIRHGARQMATHDDQREKGLALMDQGHARIDLLLQVAPTTERYALKASYYKRRAQADQARDFYNDLKDCIGAMTAQYWKAADYAFGRTGEQDYYPLFNALDGEFLLAARGERGGFDAHASELGDLLRAGVTNAQRRFALKREFFHALAQVDAQRIDALWACYDGRKERCINDAPVLDRLISDYRGVLRRLGSIREQNSTTGQFQFLIDMLPSKAPASRVKGVLEQLVEGINRDLFN